MLQNDRFLASGIDPGDDAWGTCFICGDYIWGNQVEYGEAFFEAFNPRPPHHNYCLPEFMRTGKLLPHHMKYYQNPDDLPEGIYEKDAAYVRLLQSAGINVDPMKTPISWDEAVAFLTNRYMTLPPESMRLPSEYRTKKDEAQSTDKSAAMLSLSLSGAIGVPVFACRTNDRPDLLFPGWITPNPELITSEQETSVIGLAQAKEQPVQHVVFVSSKTPPGKQKASLVRDDLNETGVIAELTPADSKSGECRVTIKTLERVKITWKNQKDQNGSPFVATLTHLPEVNDLDFDSDDVKDKIERILMVVRSLQEEMFPPPVVNSWFDHGAVIKAGKFGLILDLFAFFAARNTVWNEDLFPFRYAILETPALSERLEKVGQLASYIDQRVKRAKAKFASASEQQIKAQEKASLRGQIAALQNELGEGESSIAEEYAKKVAKARLSPEAAKAAEKQLSRLAQSKDNSMEHAVILTYLDCLIDYPWLKATTDNVSLSDAERMLDEDHYALDKPKDEIKGIIAVEKRRQYVHTVLADVAEHGVKAAAEKFAITEEEIVGWQKQAGDEKAGKTRMPILAFVGPPGTGKTSLAVSIARALGRNCVRMSLGGVKDEAKFRGHRRTYVGALPGDVVQEIKRAGSNNPVFILDEADRLGSEGQSDPSGALIEMLDPVQNSAFKDHYMGTDVPIDLSNVLFILTSNTDRYVPALADRLKKVRVDGYTEEEKIEIAKRYLTSRVRKQRYLNPDTLCITDDALQSIIRLYTHEDGVRELERCIDEICVKVVRDIEKTGNNKEKYLITGSDLPKFLGIEKSVGCSGAVSELEPGIAIGMTVTGSAMGSLGFVESVVVPGDKPFVMSVKAGESMQKSLETVSTFLHSERAARAFGYGPAYFKNRHLEYHLDMEDGGDAVDGTSAGAAMALAGLGAIKEMKFRTDTAVTGMLTAFGKLRPIGGVKAKALEARRRGIKHIVLPSANKKDLADIPEELRKEIQFHCVNNLFEAAKLCFENFTKKKNLRQKAKGSNS